MGWINVLNLEELLFEVPLEYKVGEITHEGVFRRQYELTGIDGEGNLVSELDIFFVSTSHYILEIKHNTQYRIKT